MAASVFLRNWPKRQWRRKNSTSFPSSSGLSIPQKYCVLNQSTYKRSLWTHFHFVFPCNQIWNLKSYQTNLSDTTTEWCRKGRNKINILHVFWKCKVEVKSKVENISFRVTYEKIIFPLFFQNTNIPIFSHHRVSSNVWVVCMLKPRIILFCVPSAYYLEKFLSSFFNTRMFNEKIFKFLVSKTDFGEISFFLLFYEKMKDECVPSLFTFFKRKVIFLLAPLDVELSLGEKGSSYFYEDTLDKIPCVATSCKGNDNIRHVSRAKSAFTHTITPIAFGSFIHHLYFLTRVTFLAWIVNMYVTYFMIQK